MSLTLTIRHGLSINVHRRLDARVAHQLLLDGERRSGFIQPRSIAVTERMPSDIATDSGRKPSFADLPLLNLLLVIGPPRNWIGEQPSLWRRERPFLVQHKSLDHRHIERNAIPRVLGLHVPFPAVNHAPLYQQRESREIEISPLRYNDFAYPQAQAPR